MGCPYQRGIIGDSKIIADRLADHSPVTAKLDLILD